MFQQEGELSCLESTKKLDTMRIEKFSLGE